MSYRICLNAPVIVKVANPRNEGEFTRVLGIVEDYSAVETGKGGRYVRECVLPSDR